jgi:hypothetical protein
VRLVVSDAIKKSVPFRLIRLAGFLEFAAQEDDERLLIETSRRIAGRASWKFVGFWPIPSGKE